MARNPTYYDGDLAGDLVAESLRVIECDGPAAVSLRAIGRTLGVSNAAPKNHFPNKAALFATIALEGFEALTDAVHAVGADDHETPVVAAGVAYVEFALDHPAHFAVMWQTDLHGDSAEVVTAKAAALAELIALLGPADDPSTRDAANLAWAVAHGWAALLLSGSLVVPDGLTPRDYVGRQLQGLHGLVPRHD